MTPFVPGPSVVTSARVAAAVWPQLEVMRRAAELQGPIDPEVAEWLEAVRRAAEIHRRGSVRGSVKVPTEPKGALPVRQLQTMTTAAAAELLEVSPRAVTKRAGALGGWRRHGDHGPWVFDAARIAKEATRRTENSDARTH